MMPDLVTVAGVYFLGLGQQFQRQVVVALGPHTGEDPDGGLDVVVQHRRPGLYDLAQRVPVAGEVGNQHLDAALGAARRGYG